MRQKQRVFSLFLLSPSSRRAWIEIIISFVKSFFNAVALLTEGVDRNSCIVMISLGRFSSPSSRRAWIEIVPMAFLLTYCAVALLTEGVDRNG